MIEDSPGAIFWFNLDERRTIGLVSDAEGDLRGILIFWMMWTVDVEKKGSGAERPLPSLC